MTKRLKERQEKAILRVVKAFGYLKVKDFTIGMIDDQFAQNEATIVIKMAKESKKVRKVERIL